jgi:hypothetical protein
MRKDKIILLKIRSNLIGEEYQKERLGVYTQIPELEEDGRPVYGR